MNLQQLRYVRETIRSGLSLTTAAERLHTSQPGVSRQIRQLEEELGVDLFVRHGKRVTALTGVDTEQFARVVRHVRGEQKITEQEVRQVMAGYLETARGLAHYIDQLPTDIGEGEA